jgi:hypothetical protein
MAIPVVNLRTPSASSLLLRLLSKGQPYATATGFVATANDGPVLVTNRHVVTGCHQETGDRLNQDGKVPEAVEIMHLKAGADRDWIGRDEQLRDDSGSVRWREHPRLGSKCDVIALPLTQLEGVHLIPIPLAPTSLNLLWGPADTISVVGFPFGVTGGGYLGIWSNGTVASEPEVDWNDLPVFLIDCRSRPSQSGSPVIAWRYPGAVVEHSNGWMSPLIQATGQFLGVYSGRINKESDLGMVWKAQIVREVVA